MSSDFAPLVTTLLPYIATLVLGYFIARHFYGDRKPPEDNNNIKSPKQLDEFVFLDKTEQLDGGDQEDYTNDEDREHIPFKPETYSDEEMIRRSREFYVEVNKRRSCRFFSNRGIPRELVDNLILTAGTFRIPNYQIPNYPQFGNP